MGLSHRRIANNGRLKPTFQAARKLEAEESKGELASSKRGYQPNAEREEWMAAESEGWVWT